ncbi:hypothetical protein H0H92_009609 [Tricholoma furcatifolium]|nr:hypothetical protein H0H92_009609 [Tricholoma furcatifolium]
MKTRSGNYRTEPKAKKRRYYTGAVANEDEQVHVIKKDVKKRTKGKLGKLAGLLDLPLDVLFEVFGNLNPYDLLKVARTTKEFRRLLMSKSSVTVWRAALSSIPDLPACPPEMCEPAWVNLVFDPHCHFCMKPNIRTVEWSLRTRICNTCAKSKLVDLPVPYDPDMPTEDSPHFPVQNLLLSRPCKKQSLVLWQSFILEQVEDVKAKYAALQDLEARTAFIRERRKYTADAKEHALRCSKWARAQTVDRTIELYRLKDARYAATKEKLVELGYEEDIEGIQAPYSLEDHELVKKPQKLTERIWANIRDPLIKFMEKMHKVRLRREHQETTLLRKPAAVAVYRDYIAAHHPQDGILPSGLDFCAFDPVKAILKQPVHVTVDETSFADVIERIPEFIANWRQSVDGHLVRVLKEAETYSDFSYMERYARWNDFGEFRCADDSDSDEDSLSDTASDDSLPDEQLESASNIVSSADDSDDSSFFEALKLATTVYQCSKCACKDDPDTINACDSDDDFSISRSNSYGASSFFFYPEAKAHICLMRTTSRKYNFFNDDDDYDSDLDLDDLNMTRLNDPARKLENTRELRRMWSTRPLRVNKSLGSRARVLVELAGLNPDKATVDEMDATKVWFACLQCAYNCDGPDIKKTNPPQCRYEMPAYTWRDALKHLWSEHHENEASSQYWVTVAPDDIDDAVEAWRAHPRSSSNSEDNFLGLFLPPPLPLPEDKTWCCVHCRDTPAEAPPVSMQAITTHLEEKFVARHNIQESEESRDYYKDFAAAPLVSPRRNIVMPVSVTLVEAAIDKGVSRSALAMMDRVGEMMTFLNFMSWADLYASDEDSELEDDEWY